MEKKKALLIAEKISVKKDLEKAYESIKDELPYEIDFCAQIGHLVELVYPVEINPIYKDWKIEHLPINPEHEGGWKYKVKPDMKNIYNNIKNSVTSGKYDCVIHAGDSDAEGELLVNLVLNKIGNKLPVYRLWSDDTTKKALQDALRNLKSDDDAWFKNLYNAALLRQHTDWLFGINGSRAISDRIYAGRNNKIAAGRVMTCVQTMIVDREDEIKNFVPTTTYGVGIDVSKQGEEMSVTASLLDDENAKAIFYENKEDALKILNDLKDTAEVTEVISQEEKVFAPKLYNLTAIQKEAAAAGFTAQDTLDTVQTLYERHLVSYPRTDCRYVSSSEDFPALINCAVHFPGLAQYKDIVNAGIDRVVNSTGKYVNNEERAKAGHSALTPTTDIPDYDSLSNRELYIYELIVRRFLSIFMPPQILNRTTVILNNGGHIFRAQGKVVVDAGYTAVAKGNNNDVILPNFIKGEQAAVKNAEIKERTTTCPKRYTDGTIIEAMENPAKYITNIEVKNSTSIGTVATRAGIIEKLIKDKYIERKNNNLVPTEFSIFFIHAIRGIALCRADTTGEWEQIMQNVRNGELSKEDATKYMEAQLNALLLDIKGVNKMAYDAPVREAVAICPKCGRNIYESARNFYCEGYREGCKVSIMKNSLGTQYSKSDVIKLLAGETLTKTLTKKDGKTWEQQVVFDADAEWNPVFAKREEQRTPYKCPCCKGDIVRSGAVMKCTKCDFKAWRKICGVDLSDEIIDELFIYDKTASKVDGFISPKKGTQFSARLILTKKGISFDF